MHTDIHADLFTIASCLQIMRILVCMSSVSVYMRAVKVKGMHVKIKDALIIQTCGCAHKNRTLCPVKYQYININHAETSFHEQISTYIFLQISSNGHVKMYA